jgi:hypothetical protein
MEGFIMSRSHHRPLRRAVSPVTEMLETRMMLTTVGLTGTSGVDNFTISFNSGTQQYSFTGGINTPALIAASSFTGFTVSGGGGADTLAIQGGTPVLANDGGADGTILAVTVSAGATLSMNSNEHLSSLMLANGAVGKMLATGGRLLVTNSLVLNGTAGAWHSLLDLAGNDMIVQGGGSTSLANVFSQLKSGFNAQSGYWNGTSGIVSTSAASDTRFLATLGFRAGGITFDGVNTTTSDVLVKYTYYGDADLNGVVNGADYQQIDNGFGGHLTGWSNGDFNYDGVVDGSDFSLIDNTFNQLAANGPEPRSAPSGMTIVQAVAGEIDIQWDADPDPNIVSYNVYAATDPAFVPSSGNLIASGVTGTGFTHNFIANSTDTWSYKVTAVDSNGIESLPSTAASTMMPSSTPESYTDAPNGAPLPGDYIDPPDGEPINPSVTPATTITDLVAFYGAGDTGAFGNTKFANIVHYLGGTQRTDQLPYRDFQQEQAVQDTLALIDTNHDRVITPAEIGAVKLEVLGYSWGAVAAATFTRAFAKADLNAGGTLNTGPKFRNFYTGGWNLEAPVPIKILVTIDPVLHALAGLSGLIRSTLGPESNVLKFRNYYQHRGGGTSFGVYTQPPFPAQTGTVTIPNGFSGLIQGDRLNSQSPDTVHTQVDMAFANMQLYTLYESGPDGEPLYAQLKGSQVQHDTMPLYLFGQVVSDITNA